MSADEPIRLGEDKIVEEVGRDGFGIVCKALDSTLIWIMVARVINVSSLLSSLNRIAKSTSRRGRSL